MRTSLDFNDLLFKIVRLFRACQAWAGNVSSSSRLHVRYNHIHLCFFRKVHIGRQSDLTILYDAFECCNFHMSFCLPGVDAVNLTQAGLGRLIRKRVCSWFVLKTPPPHKRHAVLPATNGGVLES